MSYVVFYFYIQHLYCDTDSKNSASFCIKGIILIFWSVFCRNVKNNSKLPIDSSWMTLAWKKRELILTLFSS